MAKFHVEVGGFVTVFRKRNLIIYADNELEAEQKAIEKFVDIQHCSGADLDTGDCTIDSIYQQ